jgi:hypothetical protein
LDKISDQSRPMLKSWLVPIAQGTGEPYSELSGHKAATGRFILLLVGPLCGGTQVGRTASLVAVRGEPSVSNNFPGLAAPLLLEPQIYRSGLPTVHIQFISMPLRVVNKYVTNGPCSHFGRNPSATTFTTKGPSFSRLEACSSYSSTQAASSCWDGSSSTCVNHMSPLGR